MSKTHLSSKELKTDGLKNALLDAKGYVASHQTETIRWIAIGAGAVVVIGAIVGGLSYRKSLQTRQLSEALATFEAPLAADNVPASVGAHSYKDAAEREADAKRKLAALAKDAPSSTSGRIAAALVFGMEGRKDASAAAFDSLRDLAQSEAGSVAAGMAAVALLDARAASGQSKEAIDIANKYLESTKSPLPKDVLMFKLGELYEKVGQTALARSNFRRLVDTFPDSPLRADAQQRSQAL